MTLFSDIQAVVAQGQGAIQASAGAVQSASTDTLTQILNQLKIQNGKGRPYVYLSDLLSIPYTTATPVTALSTPLLQFTLPPQPMNIDTVSVAWDSVAFTNYKYQLAIQDVTFGNPAFIGMASFSQSLNLFSGNVIPVGAGAQVSLFAYNFNSATSNGTMQFYLLGFLQTVQSNSGV